MKVSQYGFALNETDVVSRYWAFIGFPEFQLNTPTLNNKDIKVY